MAPKSDPRNDESVNIMLERILKNTTVTVQDALIIQKGFSEAEMKDKKLADTVMSLVSRITPTLKRKTSTFLFPLSMACQKKKLNSGTNPL
jgi:hypothetical protein